MEEHAYKRCDQLSGGQKQRVGIARALIQSPKLLLCDEPIASLDPNASKVIMDHLQTISKELNITCIVNLHQVDVAKKYSDRIIGLNNGHVVYDGTSKELTSAAFIESMVLKLANSLWNRGYCMWILAIFKKRNSDMTIFLVIVIGITLLSASITNFNFLHGIQTLPKAFSWMVSNLYITEESLDKTAIHYG